MDIGSADAEVADCRRMSRDATGELTGCANPTSAKAQNCSSVLLSVLRPSSGVQVAGAPSVSMRGSRNLHRAYASVHRRGCVLLRVEAVLRIEPHDVEDLVDQDPVHSTVFVGAKLKLPRLAIAQLLR